VFIASGPKAEALGRAFGEADLHARVQVFGEDLGKDRLRLVFDVDDAQGNIQRHIGQGCTTMVLKKAIGCRYGIAMGIVGRVAELGRKGFGLGRGEEVLVMFGLIVPFGFGEASLLGQVMLPEAVGANDAQSVVPSGRGKLELPGLPADQLVTG
jgi:hypothetical protein